MAPKAQPVDDYIPPDVSRIRDVAKAFGLDPDNPACSRAAATSTRRPTRGAVDPWNRARSATWRGLLGGPVDPDDELDSDRPIPTTIGRNGGFTDPAADDDLLGALGPRRPTRSPRARRRASSYAAWPTRMLFVRDHPTFDDIEFELPSGLSRRRSAAVR